MAEAAEPSPHYLETELIELFRSSPHVVDFLDQGSLDGMWYWDVDNPVQEWLSPRFRSVFGYGQDEIPNTSAWWQENIHPDDLQVALDNFQKHLADPEHPYDQVVRYRHKDGSTVWVRCRGLAIRDEDGRPRRLLGVHTDVTALKQAEQDLTAKNEALEQFVSMASHDLREPLRAIAGFSEIMAAELTDPSEEFSEAVDAVRSGVARMRRLIDDLLALARIDTDSQEEAVNLSDSLGEVLHDLRPLLDSTQARIDAQIDPGLAVITAPTHVHSLLQNLISNAAKYHPEDRGNHIEVTVSRETEGVLVSVADDGVGVHLKDQQRMMQPFVRLQADTHAAGSGIGLAAVARIVNAARGTIEVVSEPGQGLRFRAHLPGWQLQR
jgi:hypothetical protein